MGDRNRENHVRDVALDHVARLLDRPLATAARTAAGATVLLVVLAVVTAGEFERLAGVGSVADAVALFGGPAEFAVAVALAVLVAFLGSLWNAVVSDLRREPRS